MAVGSVPHARCGPTFARRSRPPEKLHARPVPATLGRQLASASRIAIAAFVLAAIPVITADGWTAAQDPAWDERTTLSPFGARTDPAFACHDEGVDILAITARSAGDILTVEVAHRGPLFARTLECLAFGDTSSQIHVISVGHRAGRQADIRAYAWTRDSPWAFATIEWPDGFIAGPLPGMAEIDGAVFRLVVPIRGEVDTGSGLRTYDLSGDAYAMVRSSGDARLPGPVSAVEASVRDDASTSAFTI